VSRPANRWYDAICNQIQAAGGQAVTDQIWNGMTAAGFQHHSRMPRSTLGARLAELVQMKKIERVDRRTYRLPQEASS
jgi:hypothetical protein